MIILLEGKEGALQLLGVYGPCFPNFHKDVIQRYWTLVEQALLNPDQALICVAGDFNITDGAHDYYQFDRGAKSLFPPCQGHP